MSQSGERAHLPRPIALRIADVHRHYAALALALEQTSKDQFVEAARLSEGRELLQHVYPLERAFEILCNYVAELNELGLAEAGITPVDRLTNLRLLDREGIISGQRAKRLRSVMGARNDLQHEYPDVRAAGTYQAAGDLLTELPGYLRAYVTWMRRLGFGKGL